MAKWAAAPRVPAKIGGAALVLLWLLLFLWSDSSLHAQIADRGVITGIVPDAKVTVTNQDTKIQTVVGTNGAGNYSTPPLILGTYSVQVEKQGFETYSCPGVWLL